MAADFAQIDPKTPEYPQEPKPVDSSAGFVPPNKVQTGQTRGNLQIKGKLTVADSSNVVRVVLGYDPGKF